MLNCEFCFQQHCDMYMGSFKQNQPYCMIISVNKYLVFSSPHLQAMNGHLEGVPQPYLGELLTMVIDNINHFSKWNDPPSRGWCKNCPPF